MFQKREVKPMSGEVIDQQPQRQDYIDTVNMNDTKRRPTNTVLRGSKITGDIKVSCDMDVSGEIQGNITSEGEANIHIQGTCNGSVETKKGNIIISGQLNNGNIVSGGNVTITGTFKGGEVCAQEKLYVDGTFEGKIVANEVEVGPQTQGKGEIVYGEFISIARGARIEAKVTQGKKASDADKRLSSGKIVSMPAQQAKVQDEPKAKSKEAKATT